MNLRIVLEDGFLGFGAVYEPEFPSSERVGTFIRSGDSVTAYVDRSGGVEIDQLASLRSAGFRISVSSHSGARIPLRLSGDDPTDGVRFWLLPRPTSNAIYFLVGTVADARAFDAATNRVYERRFSPATYFRGLIKSEVPDAKFPQGATEEPNKAPEPTPGSVTPRATEGVSK